MSKAPTPLPDIDDEAFRAKLAPLAKAILPPQGKAGEGSPTTHEGRVVDIAAVRDAAEATATRAAPALFEPSPAPGAAPAPRPAKPPRKGMEFLLPEAVVRQLKTEAAARGVSATVILMELLRDAGYPITDDDFLDLRKEPRR